MIMNVQTLSTILIQSTGAFVMPISLPRVYVREGFGDWEKLDKHIRNEHPEAYDALIEQQRKDTK